MRLPSLRSASVGFFAVLACLLVAAWGVSVCGSYGVAWESQATADTSATLIRGRLTIVHMEGYAPDTFGVSGNWLGAPRRMTDVLGAFSYGRFEDSWLAPPGGTITRIDIPVPPLAATAALVAYLISRRFRLTLAAWLSLLVIASIFLAAYAHPFREEHYPTYPREI